MDSIYLAKKNLLNGKELVQCRIDEPNLVLPVRGQKEIARNGTVEERDRLAKLYSDMKVFISLERIDRQCNRSRGIWHANDHTIEVISKEGNWNIFGHVKNQVQYLKPYEGLYLMEINRLELYYNSIIVSIEQAYQILLNTSESVSLQHYNVYAKLMRNGYIVFQSKDCEANTVTSESAPDYIWIYLNELLTNASSSNFCNDKEYCDVKNSMNAIIEVTKNAKFIEDDTEDESGWYEVKRNTNKRKLETKIYPKSKKIKHDLIEDCPQKFKNIFKEIDFIKLTKSNSELTECNLEFAFNLYLPNRKYFKKSNLDRPDYRIIVWDDDTIGLPSKLQLEALYFKQTYRTPIIVVLISKFFNFNAYFYYFS